jgi:4-hydroxybenzoate polyprenyltransferase
VPAANEKFARVFEQERGGWPRLPVACRVHHWIKNLLVFLPVFLAHKLLDVAALKGATLAFFAFSLCASAVYLVNDVVDLQADRAHEKKRHRPIAAGLVSIPQAMAAAALLMAVSAAIAFRAGTHFAEVLGCYLLATTLYSWWLKKQVLLDVFVLAGLYTVRVLAGGVGTHIVITPWTAAFCIFLFLSLALLKRHSDLVLTGTGHSSRGYRESDIGVLSQFGIASGYLAVLVLALYINNPDVHGLYRHPYWLWAACPILCYWISRMWLLSERGELDTDPVVFALRDRATWIAFAMTCASMLLAGR